MSNIKCYEVWADNVFLGYEYAETQAQILIAARKKYDHPKKWSVIEYTANQLTPETSNNG